MGLLYCIKILTTLLMSALGVIPNAMADVRDHLGGRFTTLDPDGRILRDENGNITKGL